MTDEEVAMCETCTARRAAAWAEGMYGFIACDRCIAKLNRSVGRAELRERADKAMVQAVDQIATDCQLGPYEVAAVMAAITARYAEAVMILIDKSIDEDGAAS